MKRELYIARRFAFKPRSISRPTFIVLASVIGIATGTAALILTLSIVNGFAGVIEGKLVRFNSHLQIRQPDEQLFAETRHDLQTLRTSPGISSAFPFLEMNVMIRSRDNARVVSTIVPAVVKAIPPEGMRTFPGSHLVEGTLPVQDRQAIVGLVAGKALAEKLGIRTGSRVMIVGFEKGSPARAIGRHDTIVDLLSSLDLEVALVTGLYETGMNEGFDDLVLFADLRALQQRFHPGMISGYEANTGNLRLLPIVSGHASKALGFPFYSSTVYERYANLFEWLKLQKNVTPVLIITITVVAVFNIVSTLLVLIIEKTREIGMLAALGLEPGRISLVFMVQALLISLFGIAAGNIVALSLSLFEQRFHLITLPEKSYFIKHVPIMINPLDYLVVSCGVAVLTLLFAYIPSRVAASLKPGTALTT